MALDHAALLDVLEAMKAAEVDERPRHTASSTAPMLKPRKGSGTPKATA